MRKLLAVMVASSIGFAPVASHAKPVHVKIEAFQRSADPFVEAVVNGLATRKRFKSYQDDLFALGAVAYADYVFGVCIKENKRECAKEVNYGYLGANLYLGEDDQFVRALCSLNSSISTIYYLNLLTEMQRRTIDLSQQEKETESGKELLRLLVVAQAEVDKTGDAYIKSPNGILLQPGCKYAIPT